MDIYVSAFITLETGWESDISSLGPYAQSFCQSVNNLNEELELKSGVGVPGCHMREARRGI